MRKQASPRKRRTQRGMGVLTLLGFVLIGLGLAGLATHFWLNRSAPAAVAPVSQGRPPAAGAAPTNADPGAGALNPAWFGRWQGSAPTSVMTVSATDLALEAEVERDGKKVRVQSACKWSGADEANLPHDGSCAFGYMKKSKALAAVAKVFEESVGAYQKDPTDFKVSDPVRGRRDLASIRPGNYRMVWLYEGGDCGYSELLVDGDTLLKVSQCKYGHSVERYARQGAVATAGGQPAQVLGAAATGPALPNGRWKGEVVQAGYPPYAAVVQLQANAAGTPAGTMLYPSLGCTATLSFLRSSGNATWYTESIQEGKGKCQDGGQISIAPMGNDLDWKYFVPGDTGTPVASATLSKQFHKYGHVYT